MSGTPVVRPQRGAWPVRVAAVLAGVLVASGLVVRLSVSLVSGSPQAQVAMAGGVGEIVLETDAGAVPVFDDVAMSPGETASACVTLQTRAAGKTTPTVLSLDAPEVTALAERLHVRVHTDTKDGCRGGSLVVAGTLAEVLASDGVPTAPSPSGLSDRWYRFDVTLDRDVTNQVMGDRLDDVRLVWAAEVLPTTSLSLSQRSVLFATGVAERSIVPLLWLLALSIGFVGVQSRIDRNDPKLANAPVDDAELEFQPR